jgi:hypothetical protein
LVDEEEGAELADAAGAEALSDVISFSSNNLSSGEAVGLFLSFANSVK